MDEYIPREAAIDAVLDVYYDTPDIDLSGEKFEEAIINIQAADVEPVQEWISVKDRLPDAGGYVVCIAKRNPFSRFMPMVARIEKNGWVNPITEQYISDVTHWMPIPQPPKWE